METISRGPGTRILILAPDLSGTRKDIKNPLSSSRSHGVCRAGGFSDTEGQVKWRRLLIGKGGLWQILSLGPGPIPGLQPACVSLLSL